MAKVALVIGESASGKTFSLRNLNPDEILLIQSHKKDPPFRNKAWAYKTKDNPGGNMYFTDDAEYIAKKIMPSTTKKIIIIDDFQYIMANEFMRRSAETGYTKFTEIGKRAWDILNAAALLADDVRVYILSHTSTDENGFTRIKTIGKMLDDKIVIEGMFNIVIRARIVNGKRCFFTQSDGYDTAKSPFGMFKEEVIDNDLSIVDKAICDYYEINSNTDKQLEG